MGVPTTGASVSPPTEKTLWLPIWGYEYETEWYLLQTYSRLSWSPPCSLAPLVALAFLKVTQCPLSSHLENMNPVLALALRQSEVRMPKDLYRTLTQGPRNKQLSYKKISWNLDHLLL